MFAMHIITLFFPIFLKISRSSEDESDVETCKGGGQKGGEVDLKR